MILNSGRSGWGSAKGRLVVPRSTCPGATSMPIWLMLWQKTQELRTGLPKPIGELIPALSLIRNVLSRNTLAPHPHYGRVILTHDPGYALTTGRCADVGRITLQSLRGLAARAPYFSNGSAKDLRAVIDYYDRRYNIGYTEREKQDLVNLMRAL